MKMKVKAVHISIDYENGAFSYKTYSTIKEAKEDFKQVKKCIGYADILVQINEPFQIEDDEEISDLSATWGAYKEIARK